ncbi:MAG TPA: hypothetical protein VGB05_11515 [Pyrinomonadaceae bacterium]|jgi:hypothetical protein
MAINRALRAVRTSIEWNGEKAADVRGLTPTDIAAALTSEGDKFDGILEAFDMLDLTAGTDALADQAMQQAPMIVMKLAANAPRFIANLIAFAADDVDAVDDVMLWPAPLQFEVLTEIARLTFAGPEKLHLFLGNVAALVDILSNITGKPAVKAPAVDRPTPPSEEERVLPAGM